MLELINKISMGADKKIFNIQERRRRVAALLAQSKTESECAQILGVSQPTISNDVQALKEMSQQFVYDLAKGDLAYRYKQEIDTMDEVKRRAWDFCNDEANSVKERLLALKLVIDAGERKFKMLSEGPAILTMKSLDDRVTNLINGRQSNQNKV
jgi:hypothetical protein